MARTAITVTAISTTAAAPPAETTGNTVDGHYVVHSGLAGGSDSWLVVRNADSGGPHTISVGYKSVDGQVVDPKDYPIPASSTRNVRLGSPNVHGTRTNIDVDSTQLKIIAHKLG